MPKSVDYVGVKRHSLTCIGYEALSGYRYLLTVRCDCGTVKQIHTAKFGATKSCGCQNHVPKHGQSRTKLYQRFLGLKDRCENPSHTAYRHYGGKGVRCHWRTFEEFLRDMGEPPSERLSIERVDREGDYCKENCIWADHMTQMNNTSRNTVIELDGERLTIAQWARRLGVKQNSITQRYTRAGWSAERTLRTPFAEHRRNALREHGPP